ncbi:hypothetical protein, partial [Escherichia coli]
RIVQKWRLQPGKMFMIDLEKGAIIEDGALKHELSTEYPYDKWINDSRFFLTELEDIKYTSARTESLLDTQQAFGYTQEDIKFILAPMAAGGEEA